jgi:dihydroorotase
VAKIPLPAALARITVEPARVLGVDAGHLAAGAAADVCIVAIDEAWTVTRDALESQGKNTPFLGLELAGRVRYTLVDGQIVYQSDASRPVT